jgi:hypothetical protein
MKPILKEIYIQDHGFLDQIFSIQDCFHVKLEILITHIDSIGGDEYSIDLCDKEGLKKEINQLFESDYERLNKTNFSLLHKTLVVEKYDNELIKKIIEDLITSCAADTWSEISIKLREYFDYEP